MENGGDWLGFVWIYTNIYISSIRVPSAILGRWHYHSQRRNSRYGSWLWKGFWRGIFEKNANTSFSIGCVVDVRLCPKIYADHGVIKVQCIWNNAFDWFDKIEYKIEIIFFMVSWSFSFEIKKNKRSLNDMVRKDSFSSYFTLYILLCFLIDLMSFVYYYSYIRIKTVIPNVYLMTTLEESPKWW